MLAAEAVTVTMPLKALASTHDELLGIVRIGLTQEPPSLNLRNNFPLRAQLEKGYVAVLYTLLQPAG